MTTVNILTKDNGLGLSRSTQLLQELLSIAGFQVYLTRITEQCLERSAICAGQRSASWPRRAKHKLRRWLAARRDLHERFDVNLFLESVVPEWFCLARINCLVPNQEWFEPWWCEYLPRFDRVLCKTRHAEQIFQNCGARTEFISFTSYDRRDRQITRDDRRCFHLAGGSLQKGTIPLVELWRRHPEWPTLTVVQHPEHVRPAQAANVRFIANHLDDATLRSLQNSHGIHVCPSEAEGFGHYLVEAMSCAVIVVTTDAPPMNEIVSPKRGLLARYAQSRGQRLGTNYHVDVVSLEHQIELAFDLPVAQRREFCQSARRWFETNDRFFRLRVVESLHELVRGIAATGHFQPTT